MGKGKWDKKMGVKYIGGRLGVTICVLSWGRGKDGSVLWELIPQSPNPKFVPHPEVPNIFK